MEFREESFELQNTFQKGLLEYAKGQEKFATDEENLENFRQGVKEYFECQNLPNPSWSKEKKSAMEKLKQAQEEWTQNLFKLVDLYRNIASDGYMWSSQKVMRQKDKKYLDYDSKYKINSLEAKMSDIEKSIKICQQDIRIFFP